MLIFSMRMSCNIFFIKIIKLTKIRNVKVLNENDKSNVIKKSLENMP